MGLFSWLFRWMCKRVFDRVDYNKNGRIEALEVEVAILQLYNQINKRLPGWQNPPTRDQIQASSFAFAMLCDAICSALACYDHDKHCFGGISARAPAAPRSARPLIRPGGALRKAGSQPSAKLLVYSLGVLPPDLYQNPIAVHWGLGARVAPRGRGFRLPSSLPPFGSGGAPC